MTSIKGQKTLTRTDHMNWAFARPFRFVRNSIIIVTLYTAAMIVFDLPSSDNFSFELIGSWLLRGVIMLIALIAFLYVVTLFFQIRFFNRLSEAQKQVSWEIDEQRIRVSDGSSNVIETPWLQIKTWVVKPKGFLFDLKPAGSRWLPKDAFSNEDVQRISEIAKGYGLV